MRAHHTGGLLVAHVDVAPAQLLVGYVGVTLATAVARFQRQDIGG